MMEYVLGFIFSKDKNLVVVMHKNRPSSQKGKINGIGGSIGAGETSTDAMIRECKEETSVETVEQDWTLFAKINGRGYEVDCFKMFNDYAIVNARTTTDEEIEVVKSEDITRLASPTAFGVVMLIEQVLNGVVDYLEYSFDN